MLDTHNLSWFLAWIKVCVRFHGIIRFYQLPCYYSSSFRNIVTLKKGVMINPLNSHSNNMEHARIYLPSEDDQELPVNCESEDRYQVQQHTLPVTKWNTYWNKRILLTLKIHICIGWSLTRNLQCMNKMHATDRLADWLDDSVTTCISYSTTVTFTHRALAKSHFLHFFWNSQ